MTGVPPEVVELEAAADWRLRMVDADPDDSQSAAAAERLQRLADDLRRYRATSLHAELGAICNWLAESDDITDFAQLAHDYRRRIGIDAFPDTGEDYLRALLDIARQTFGTP
jgi:hypothetical protein